MLRMHLFFPVLVATSLVGCGQSTHLVHYQRTIVGFDAAASLDGGSGHILLGYDRRFAAAVPRTTLPEGDVEAMSTIVCTDIETQSIYKVRFSERLATGLAAQEYAKEFAKNPTESAFKCFDSQGDK